jgi:hypothetical protein
MKQERIFPPDNEQERNSCRKIVTMKQALPSLLTLLLAVIPSLAQKTPTGSASGNITVDGKPIPLRYAYALQVDDVETAGLTQMSDPTKYQVLVLSDRPLSRASVENRYAPYSERRSPGQIFEPLEPSPVTKMYGVLLKFDTEKKSLFHAEFFYPGKDISFSIAGAEVPDKLEGLKVANGWISGTARMPRLRETHLEKGPKKYQYKVSFRAPLLSEAAVTEKWDGKDALENPPVQTLRAYLAAAKEGDVEKLRSLTAASHLAYLKKPEVIKMLREADMSKVNEQVKRVVVRGNLATILVIDQAPNYAELRMNLVREKGAWKLCCRDSLTGVRACAASARLCGRRLRGRWSGGNEPQRGSRLERSAAEERRSTVSPDYSPTDRARARKEHSLPVPTALHAPGHSARRRKWSDSRQPPRCGRNPYPRTPAPRSPARARITPSDLSVRPESAATALLRARPVFRYAA